MNRISMPKFAPLQLVQFISILVITSTANCAMPRGEFRDASLFFTLGEQAEIWQPWVSDDGLRIYFQLGWDEAGEIHFAERASVNEQFDTPTRLPDNVNIDPFGWEGNVFLMDEERTLLFESASAGPSYDNLLITQRDNLDSPWNDPVPVSFDFFEEFERIVDVEFTNDKRAIYFTGREFDSDTLDVYVARRDSIGDPFVSYEPVGGIASEGFMEEDQTVSSDQLAIFYEVESRLRLRRIRAMGSVSRLDQ